MLMVRKTTTHSIMVAVRLALVMMIQVVVIALAVPLVAMTAAVITGVIPTVMEQPITRNWLMPFAVNLPHQVP